MSVENIIKALKDGDNVNAEKINIASEIGKRKINDEDQ